MFVFFKKQNLDNHIAFYCIISIIFDRKSTNLYDQIIWLRTISQLKEPRTSETFAYSNFLIGLAVTISRRVHLIR